MVVYGRLPCPDLPLFRLPRSPLIRRTDLRTAAPARPCKPRANRPAGQPTA
jgi:hypothetical protein